MLNIEIISNREGRVVVICHNHNTGSPQSGPQHPKAKQNKQNKASVSCSGAYQSLRPLHMISIPQMEARTALLIGRTASLITFRLF